MTSAAVVIFPAGAAFSRFPVYTRATASAVAFWNSNPVSGRSVAIATIGELNNYQDAGVCEMRQWRIFRARHEPLSVGWPNPDVCVADALPWAGDATDPAAAAHVAARAALRRLIWRGWAHAMWDAGCDAPAAGARMISDTRSAVWEHHATLAWEDGALYWRCPDHAGPLSHSLDARELERAYLRARDRFRDRHDTR